MNGKRELARKWVPKGRHRGPARQRQPWARMRALRQRGNSRAHIALGIGSAAVILAVVLVSLPSAPSDPPQPQRPGEEPFQASFSDGTQLVTNELAYREPRAVGVQLSQDWLVTSGSLFARHGTAWTGQPDAQSPDAHSREATGSAVFRAVTKRSDFADVRVHFQLRVYEFVTTEDTPPQDYDGVHAFLRYQNERHLYAVSVSRRDDSVVVKKKTPGGPSNGGSYVTLGQKEYDFARDTWVPVDVRIVTLEDGSVRIRLALHGDRVLAVTDAPQGARAPIRAPGRVGLRGDNTEFKFRDFTARPLR